MINQNKLFIVALLIAIPLNGIINVQSIDSFLKNQKNFSGTVLIAQEGKILLNEGYGYANYEFDISNHAHTKFPIASNTKLFTAVAIMQLQEKGLLNVQNSLDKYIPDFPQSNAITIHHLLTHTSGIQDYYKQWIAIRDCQNLDEMVTVIKKWHLEFDPGTGYAYSNSGYTLLAYIIEKVTGQSYQEYIEKNIFEPLNMHNSGSVTCDLMIKNRAQGYLFKNDALYIASGLIKPLLIGNGDIYSTTEDMYFFYRAICKGELLRRNSRLTLIKPHTPTSDTRAHAYGCFIDSVDGKQFVEYTGALVGFLSWCRYYIEDDITIIVLTNVENMEQFEQIYKIITNF